MKLKTKIYSITLLIAIILNCIWYRQFFIEKWMWLQLRNENVVVSLSTTPYRINKMQDTIESLLAQNAPIKNIYLSVPYKFKRDNLDYQIPQWLSSNPKITILRTEDYGPATKLLGVLKMANLPLNTIIVTVDDDIVYPENLVLQLAYKAKQNPQRAIGLLGANPEYDQNGVIVPDVDLGLTRVTTNDALVSILQGYGGVAYRRYFFSDSIFNIVHAPKDCIASDDLYLSFYLAKHNVQRQVLRNDYINMCALFWDTPTGEDEHALHKIIAKPADKHRTCIAYMKQKDPHVAF